LLISEVRSGRELGQVAKPFTKLTSKISLVSRICVVKEAPEERQVYDTERF
jgi:hypothetical protein